MTLEDAKTLAQIIALGVGGLWAIYGLIAFRKREKAVADLRNTQKETQKTEQETQKVKLETQKLEFESRRFAVIRADIEATSFRQFDGRGYCVVAQVSLTNTGLQEA